MSAPQHGLEGQLGLCQTAGCATRQKWTGDLTSCQGFGLEAGSSPAADFLDQLHALMLAHINCWTGMGTHKIGLLHINEHHPSILR